MENSLYRAESTQEAAKKDIPGVICPAPLLTFGSLIVGLLLEYFVSLEMLRAHVGRLLRFVVAAILILIGLWLLWVGNAVLRRIGTAVLPWKPSRVLAKTGIYSETRNPIYQGFVVLVLGLAILFRSDWTVLLLVPAVLVLHYGVILREERYLEGKFGDVYRTFTQDVPRYGLPFAASRRAEVAVGLSAAALIAGLIAVVARGRHRGRWNRSRSESGTTTTTGQYRDRRSHRCSRSSATIPRGWLPTCACSRTGARSVRLTPTRRIAARSSIGTRSSCSCRPTIPTLGPIDACTTSARPSSRCRSTLRFRLR
jgi:protein-S-isoprenylcysteine O-methyltransferase Ste14